MFGLGLVVLRLQRGYVVWMRWRGYVYNFQPRLSAWTTSYASSVPAKLRLEDPADLTYPCTREASGNRFRKIENVLEGLLLACSMLKLYIYTLSAFRGGFSIQKIFALQFSTMEIYVRLSDINRSHKKILYLEKFSKAWKIPCIKLLQKGILKPYFSLFCPLKTLTGETFQSALW